MLKYFIYTRITIIQLIIKNKDSGPKNAWSNNYKINHKIKINIFFYILN